LLAFSIVDFKKIPHLTKRERKRKNHFILLFLFLVISVDSNSSQIDVYDSILREKVNSFTNLHKKPITFLKYLPFNSLVASASEDKTVNVWDPNTGQSIQIYNGHNDSVTCIDQIESDKIVSGSDDKTIRIWRISTGETLKIIYVNDAVNTVKVFSNGFQHQIICGLSGSIFQIYSYLTGVLVKTLDSQRYGVNYIEILNEQFMVSNSDENYVLMWDLQTCTIKNNFTHHTEWVFCLKRLSSNLVASMGFDQKVIIWNWLTGEIVHTFRCLIGDFYQISLDLFDSQTLISTCFNSTIKLWNIFNGQLIQTINTDIQIKSLAMLKTSKHVKSSKILI
jgi:WD40 repeat protein